jgi:hypothetical protein
MEPVIFGNKRALRLSLNKKNRRSFIIDKLRSFISVRMWENEIPKWNYESFQKMKETPYLLRPVPIKRNKSGNIVNCPNYFFLLTNIDNRKCCYFIEKKKPLDSSNIYQTRFRFKDELFNDTLICGTLTQTSEMSLPIREEITEVFSSIFTKIKREVNASIYKNKYNFVCNDLWVYKGKDNSSMLSQRLVQLQDIFGREWYPDLRMDNCHFNLVQYSNYNEIEDFLRNDRKYFTYDMSDHKIVSLSTNNVPGTEEYWFSLKYKVPKPSLNESMVYKDGKWSVNNIINTDNDIDNKEKELILKKSDFPDVYLVYNPANNKKLGLARVRTMDESKKLRNFFNNTDNIKILCKWVPEFEKWQPIVTK